MWWASVPRDQWPDAEQSLKFIESNWVDGIGYARQELVFIGIEMNEAELRAKLDAALLTDEEMAEGPHLWSQYPDPIESWFED